jgi:hypothetical protein
METETIKLAKIVIRYWGKKNFQDLLNDVFTRKKIHIRRAYLFHFCHTEYVNGVFYGEINKTKLSKSHEELISKESLEYRPHELDELYEYARFAIFPDHSIVITSKSKFTADDVKQVFIQLFLLNCDEFAQISINYQKDDYDIFAIISSFSKLIEVKIKNLRKSNPSPRPTFEKIEKFLSEEQTDEYSATFLADEQSKGLNRTIESHIMSAISLADAGYAEDSILKGLIKKDGEYGFDLITISTKDKIIQSRIPKTEKSQKVEFINLVFDKFSKYIKYHAEE